MRNCSKVGGRKGMSARNAKQSVAGGPGYRTSVTFKNRVFKVVVSIPRGKTLSYKEVAVKAGKSKAYRAVGNILNKNYDPEIPCHRVIKYNGSPGGYNKGIKEKISILEKERRRMDN